MRRSIEDLTEIFSVGSNDSNPSIREIRRKKIDKNSSSDNSDITTYEVVAHIAKNQKIKIKDKALSSAEIDFIQHQFCN